MTREEARALPPSERASLAGKFFWATLYAPVPSATDAKWDKYLEALRLLDLPEWFVEDAARPHVEWKEKRNAKRNARRRERRQEEEDTADADEG